MNQNDREPVDEARWQAQERARRGDVDANADELRIAHALRRAPPVDLPFDFAAQVASMAQAQAAMNSLFEQRLLRGLTLVFAVSALVVVAWYGRGWAAELAAILPGGHDALGWSVVAACCVLGNWGFGALRRKFEHAAHTAA